MEKEGMSQLALSSPPTTTITTPTKTNTPPNPNPNPIPPPSPLLLPAPPTPTKPVSSSSSSSECSNCGCTERWILHQVRIRGIQRRLCTSCVLRLHPSSFCPSCFQFYESALVPALSKRHTCAKCSSFTHFHCLPSPTAPYVCPPCASPSFSFFDAAPGRPLDRRRALVLLCAARISAASMAKALLVARAEAERRVREAAAARKRARDAIENLAIVVTTDNNNGIDAARFVANKLV